MNGLTMNGRWMEVSLLVKYIVLVPKRFIKGMYRSGFPICGMLVSYHDSKQYLIVWMFSGFF